MPIHRHHCYGLNIASDLALLEMPVDAAGAGEPEVTIRFGEVRTDALPETDRYGPFLWGRPGEMWLRVPGAANFHVRGGNTITLDPAPGADDDSLRVFLMGSALGALLWQRGFLVLHGNAIRIDDRAVVCVGGSGAGKSTLAAGFWRRGHELLADDVVAIDPEGRAWPGLPHIKLWQNAADLLGVDTSGLRRVRPGMNKFYVPVPRRADLEPVPVAWIVVLRKGRFPPAPVEILQGMARLAPLHQHAYRIRYVKALGLLPDKLHRVGELAGRVRMARTAAAVGDAGPDALVERVLTHLRG